VREHRPSSRYSSSLNGSKGEKPRRLRGRRYGERRGSPPIVGRLGMTDRSNREIRGAEVGTPLNRARGPPRTKLRKRLSR
jgi:hypothetical protein